ncbi:MAG: hypothetical protein K2X87_25545 [Gemmataceae bacterium]|nr:hypothetical protein [Gemmataceae bacterium]
MLALGVFLTRVCRLPGSDDNSSVEARAATLGYGANLRAFDHLRCEFTSRQGTAASAEDAKTGRMAVDRACDSVLFIDGSNIRLDNRGVSVQEGHKNRKGEPLAGTGLVRLARDFCVQSTYLWNGVEEMVHDAGMAINVYTPDLPASPAANNPLATGVFDWRLQMTPDRMAGLPGQFDLIGEGVQTLDGRPTVRARFITRSGQTAWVVDYDPARGYLPYRVQRLSRPEGTNVPLQLEVESWVTEAKDCGKGRFFPTRVVTVSPVGDGTSTVLFWETLVKSVDPDFKPTPETFAYRPSAGTPVIYFRSGLSPGFELDRSEAIRPSDLPSLVERAKLRLPNVTGEVVRRPRWWLWAGGGLGSVALLLLGLLIVRRLGRDKSPRPTSTPNSP